MRYPTSEKLEILVVELSRLSASWTLEQIGILLKLYATDKDAPPSHLLVNSVT